MARTKASVGAKLSCGKSSKARNLNAAAPPAGSPSTSGCKVVASGNAYCPRPTPPWQSPITRFFLGGPQETAELGGSSKAAKPREDTSDTESDQETSSRVEAMETSAEPAAELDCSVISNNEERPISPDPTSHKIVEYFESSKSDSRADHNGDLKADHSTAKNNATATPTAKSKGKGKGKGKKTVEKPSENGDEDKLVSDNEREIQSINLNSDDTQSNSSVAEEKENLKPNAIKTKETQSESKKAEKRELLEAEENEVKTKRTRIA